MTTTWNPSDKASTITLSNGNLSATCSASGTGAGVRAASGKSAGLLGFEVKIATFASGGIVGLGTSLNNVASQNPGYSGTGGFGWYSSGQLQFNGSFIASGVSWALNDVLGFYVDFTASKAYFSKNGTFVFGTNPATSTGISFTAGTSFFPMTSPNTGVHTANFGATTFASTPPSGFSQWDPPVTNLTADAGTFAATGIAAGLRATRLLSADGGTFTTAGVDPGLTKGQIFAATGASLSSTGSAAGLAVTRLLTADGSSGAVTGNVVVLQAGHNFLLDALTGSFGASGIAAAFRRTYVLAAARGEVNAYGIDADVCQSQSRLLTALGGETLFRALLVTMEFTSETMRVWQGEGRLNLGGDGIFLGMGRFGEISAVEQPVAGAAPQISLSLSGVDEDIVAMALASEAEVKGRPITIAIGVWDPLTREYLGKITPLRGVMDRMVYSASAEVDDESGRISRSHTIQVTVESILASRRILPSQSTYSAADQKLQFPADRGLDFAGTLAYKSYHWPIFPP